MSNIRVRACEEEFTNPKLNKFMDGTLIASCVPPSTQSSNPKKQLYDIAKLEIKCELSLGKVSKQN